jgi:radical SAM superfamily enzyme with C-terminal helix-hairpin-helix motif
LIRRIESYRIKVVSFVDMATVMLQGVAKRAKSTHTTARCGKWVHGVIYVDLLSRIVPEGSASKMLVHTQPRKSDLTARYFIPNYKLIISNSCDIARMSEQAESSASCGSWVLRLTPAR